MSKNEIEIKSNPTLAQAASYLRDLAACLEKGRVVLQRGDEFIELSPAQSLELEIEGVEKKGRQKINLELSWRLGAPEPAAQLKISAEAPTPPPVEEPTAEQAAPVLSAAPAETPAKDAAAKDEAEEAEKNKAGRGCRK